MNPKLRHQIALSWILRLSFGTFLDVNKYKNFHPTTAVFYVQCVLFPQQYLSLKYCQLSFAVGDLIVHDHFDRPLKRDFHYIHKLVSIKVLA